MLEIGSGSPSSGQWSAFIPLEKFDEVTGIGSGTLALEELDKSGEIMDYATAKPKFQAAAEEFQKASGGKSVLALREMHRRDTSAGIFTKMIFDDDAKKINVHFKVNDPVVKQKAADGNYTGLSVGGSYEKKWDDEIHKGAVRYTPLPVEGSLVDSPCMPSARFELHRADGATELKKFAVATPEPSQIWNCGDREHEHKFKWEAAKCIETGDLEKRDFNAAERKKAAKSGAAMTDGSFPIENSSDLHNAMQAIGRAKNPAKAKAHIKARAKALGLTSELTDAFKSFVPDDLKKHLAKFARIIAESGSAEPELKKCLWQIGQLANATQSVKWVQEAEEQEAAMEGDNSPIPAALEQIVKDLHEALVQMAEEEAAEYSAGDDEGDYDEGEALAMAARAVLKKAAANPGRLAKAFAREGEEMDLVKLAELKKAGTITPEQEAELKKQLDAAKTLIAEEKPAETPATPPVEKSEPIGDLAKLTAETADLRKTIETQSGAISLLLSAIPERSKVALRAVTVTKADDAETLSKNQKVEELEKRAKSGDAQAVIELTKLSLERPMTMGELRRL